MAKKKLITLVCATLILAGAIAGTIAYFTHTTGPVTNTFIMGKLLDDPDNFILKEHKALDGDGTIDASKDGKYTLDLNLEIKGNTYDGVVPGVDLPKDPFVKTNETLKLDAYVFVEVVEKNFGKNLHYTVDSDNWKPLSGVTGPQGGKVYVVKANNGIVKAGSKLESINILNDNKLIVDNAEVTDSTAQYGGTLAFYGYMIQAGGFDNYSKAWDGFVGISQK